MCIVGLTGVTIALNVVKASKLVQMTFLLRELSVVSRNSSQKIVQNDIGAILIG